MDSEAVRTSSARADVDDEAPVSAGPARGSAQASAPSPSTRTARCGRIAPAACLCVHDRRRRAPWRRSHQGGPLGLRENRTAPERTRARDHALAALAARRRAAIKSCFVCEIHIDTSTADTA
jgi:hypothetical protein